MTDGDGRVTFQATPGAAELTLGFAHSAAMRLVLIPARDEEQSIDFPTGTLLVRVVTEPDAYGQLTPPRISAIWATRGRRVEGVASPTGDVLLDAVGSTPGVLTIRAPGYRSVVVGRISASRSPGTIPLERVRGASLRVVIVSSQGHPVPGAAVEIAPPDPLADAEIGITDSAGRVSFVHVPAGPVWITAAAEGFRSSTRAQVTPAAEADGAVRVILREEPPAVGPSAMK